MTDVLHEESTRDEADYLSFKPGQRLKKAREVGGLSVDQVARELHLSVRMINLIEADAYKDLPEPAFVRGYMRRYASLVKLSPDDIAGKFDHSYAADTETPAVDARPRNPVQLLGSIARRPRLKLGRLLSWASFVLMMALVIGVLWAGFQSNEAEPVADIAPLPATAPAMTVPVTSAPVPAATAPAGLPTLPTPSSNTSVVASPASPAPTAAPVPAPAAVASPSVAVPATAAVAAGADALGFTLTAASWISVQDGKRKSLISATQPAGQLTLRGDGPFYVNVGNAGAVTLTFNGRVIDLKPHTKGAVATLTLKR